MKIVISKIAYDTREGDFASINDWEAWEAPNSSSFHVGVIFPSNKRFNEDFKHLLKQPLEYLIDFFLVSSSGLPIAWKIGGEIMYPIVDVPWKLNIETSNKAAYLIAIEEFIKEFLPKVKEAVFMDLQTYYDSKKGELIYQFTEEEVFIKSNDIVITNNRVINDIDILNSTVPGLINKLKTNPDDIYSISPRDFEKIIAEIFYKSGFEITLTKRTRDGGKDIIAINRNSLGIDTKYFIECKRHSKQNKVGVDIVRSLYGVHSTKVSPNKSILATTSTFTAGAIDFARKEAKSEWELSLKDNNDIMQWINDY